MAKRKRTKKPATKSPAKPRTYQQLAQALGVSARTITDWRTHFAVDWPERPKSGVFDLEAIDRFLQLHKLGRHNPSKTTGRSANVTLTEARTRSTLEQAELRRLQKEREQLAQQRELGRILLAEDVLQFHRQTAAVVMQTVDGAAEAIDRALPETTPTAETWPEVRQRIYGIVAKLNQDIASAVEALTEPQTEEQDNA